MHSTVNQVFTLFLPMEFRNSAPRTHKWCNSVSCSVYHPRLHGHFHCVMVPLITIPSAFVFKNHASVNAWSVIRYGKINRQLTETFNNILVDNLIALWELSYSVPVGLCKLIGTLDSIKPEPFHIHTRGLSSSFTPLTRHLISTQACQWVSESADTRML
jgi:hypothetical protein